jgi:hypothetical protein
MSAPNSGVRKLDRRASACALLRLIFVSHAAVLSAGVIGIALYQQARAASLLPFTSPSAPFHA